jgi:hypothetical protein
LQTRQLAHFSSMVSGLGFRVLNVVDVEPSSSL